MRCEYFVLHCEEVGYNCLSFLSSPDYMLTELVPSSLCLYYRFLIFVVNISKFDNLICNCWAHSNHTLWEACLWEPIQKFPLFYQDMTKIMAVLSKSCFWMTEKATPLKLHVLHDFLLGTNIVCLVLHTKSSFHPRKNVATLMYSCFLFM